MWPVCAVLQTCEAGVCHVCACVCAPSPPKEQTATGAAAACLQQASAAAIACHSLPYIALGSTEP